MRLKLTKILGVTGCFIILSGTLKAQSFSFNCTRDTLVPGCPPNLCITLKSIIPDLHGLSSSYALNPGSNIPGCFPVYVAPDDPAGNPTNLTIDDRYSSVINIGFPFPFYGTIYTDLVASTNGYLSFDISRASQPSHWQNFGDLPTASYDKALIMGPYHDLDPSTGTSPTQRIQYQVFGTAPYRRWIFSFYKVPLFNCTNLINNTHQVILYESTGIIEVKIFDKQICNSWPPGTPGRAMVGIQDFSRTQATMAPGRKMSDAPWGSLGMNETWRFVPNAGPSLFKRVELYDMSGNLLVTGSTTNLGNGMLEASFPNVCAPAGSTTAYVVRSVFEKIDDPSVEIFGTDTVRINRAIALTGTATPTAANCGSSNGTITVTGVTGGTPPYEYSLDGITWQASNTFTGLAPGTYTVRVRDAGAVCNVNLPPVTITVIGNIAETHTTTATACFGVDNGSIIITSAGGTGPYTFTLDGGLPQAGTIPFTFSNVAGGTHNVVVTDLGSGCTSGILIITVPIGAGLNGTAVMTPTSCTGLNDGTIVANALSGTAPYTYQLDGGTPQSGANPYTFTGVANGLHNVIIRDFFGCSIPLPVTVSAGAGVTGTGSGTATSCTGVNDGTITVTATSGTAPFTWSLDGGTPQSGASPFTFNGVAPGPHTVIITDALTCTAPVSVTVVSGTTPTATSTSTPTACSGINNGTITVTSTTMAGPYTFSLDGGAPQAGTIPFTFTNVAAGPHTIVVAGASACTTNPFTETVAAGATPTATASSTSTACTGVNNGSITINSASIAGPYTFTLDAGAPQAGTIPFTFSNVPAGPHNIVVTGASGCATNPFSVTVGTGAGVTGTATPVSTTCPTAINGSITVDATAGTAPFTYQLDAGGPQSGANPYTFSNVSAGSHTVIITDNLGCSVPIINIVVNAGPVLTANTSSSATSCNGASNGTITVTPNGGTAPFTWSIDAGPFVPGASPFTFTNLASGSHTIVVMDAAGCTTNPFTETVVTGPTLTTSVNTTAVLCNGGNTGTIVITQPAFGTPPFEYSLDGVVWQAGNTFSGLIAGPYTAYYRESNGCPGSQLVTVSEPAALTATVSEIPVVCNGQPNGTITVTPAGGTGPYEYSIDGGATWQSSNIFNVAANIYTITIRDANNCITTQGITVTEPAVLTASSVNTTASCDGGTDGTITVTAIGGNAGYQYSLDGTTFQASNVFNVLPGPYTVTVKDNLGCITSFPTTVTLLGNLTFTPQIDATICEGKSTSLQLVSNATVYAWTPTTGLSDPTSSSPVANPTIPTEYYVEATLGLCKAYDTVMVNVYAAPVPDAGTPGFICYGQTYTLQGSGGVQYLWTPAGTLSSATAQNPVATPTRTTIYTLSIVSDLNGCNSLVTDNVIVDVTPPIKVTTFPYDTVAYAMDQIQLNATSAAPNYTWTPTTGLSDPGVPNPIVTVGNVGDDIMYKVTAYTAAGCKGEGFVRVRVYNGPDLYVPTAFTPNGDGRNDTFYPFPVGIKAINYFRVFNRWGQQVFSSVTLNQGWDGKLGGVEQPSGTYVWMAQGVTKDNKVITKKGTVTIIR